MEVNDGRRAAMRLTRRERQIVEAVSKGMKNKQIAEALGITPGTVKVHLMHIFEKTGARNRFQLALQGPELLRYSSEDV
jgi:DNA-binding NarL/FixJ family response regulator